MSVRVRRHRSNRSIAQLLLLVLVVFAIDSAITTGLISLVSDAPVNEFHLMAAMTFNVVSIPIALGLNVGFPAWIWGFVIVAWIGQVVTLIIPIETLVSQVISLAVAGLFGIGGVVLGGWAFPHTIDVFVAVFMPLSSGVAMWAGGPFEFAAPELGVVLIGWLLIVIINSASDD